MNNLICHIWPGPEGTWRRTVEHLLARLSLFQHARISIAVEKPGDEFPVIQAFYRNRKWGETSPMNPDNGHLLCCYDLGPEQVTLETVWNQRHGEAVSFPRLIQGLNRYDGHTFYCHSKGASYPPGSLSEQWADIMFHLCLDYPVGPVLQDYPIAGAFRRIENRMYVPWHYSGTFFWFRNRDVFSRNWRQPMEDRNDVERWPARLFPAEESGDLGLADCRNLYDEVNWRSWIENRFRREVQWARKADRIKRVGLPETTFEPLREIYGE